MFPFEQVLNEEEKNTLISKYRTLEEGYIILYLQAEFEKRGYTVSLDNKDVQHQLVDGRKMQFDLRIEKDGIHQHIDYVNGTLPKEDFYYRLQKHYEVSPDLFIIAKDEETLHHYVKQYCFKWMVKCFGGWEKAKGNLTLHFSTLQWLITNEKVWETITFE